MVHHGWLIAILSLGLGFFWDFLWRLIVVVDLVIWYWFFFGVFFNDIRVRVRFRTSSAMPTTTLLACVRSRYWMASPSRTGGPVLRTCLSCLYSLLFFSRLSSSLFLSSLLPSLVTRALSPFSRSLLFSPPSYLRFYTLTRTGLFVCISERVWPADIVLFAMGFTGTEVIRGTEALLDQSGTQRAGFRMR